MEQIIYLTGKKMQLLENAHGHLREKLHFPEHYGENLDAFFDCLTEITQPTILIISQWDIVFPPLRQVLLRAEQENENIQIQIKEESL